MAQQAAFATGVLPYIYEFYLYTWSSTCLYHTLVCQYPRHHGVEPRTFTSDLTYRLRTLYAQ